ncbi:glycosyltransferase family 2 protein [Snuella lapsa]|uniref:Glycosyltransferase 2-like domain-containing protein n=1 Tax=Snuella lapsa TaxID=870481 RepID=A0ABP6XTH3_9FLAO
MLISIIIPTRNRFEHVSLLLADILNQDISNYEIIVVDQSDDPKPLAHCKHIVTDTLGPCVSRNIGAKHSEGGILVFLDDDARIEANFLREITHPIVHDRFDVVAGAICDPTGAYKPKGNSFLKTKNANFIKVMTSNPEGAISRITLAFPAGCSAMLKTVFNAVGGFEESFDPTGAGEDRDMALKLYQHGYAIWYNANAKLLHATAPTGGSREVGSRSVMLDVHTYRMCKTYFSEELAENIKQVVLKRYRDNFKKALFKWHKVRTKYRVLKQVKRLLNE